MAVSIVTAQPCARCGYLIPAGSTVEKNRTAARGAYLHRYEHECRKAAVAAVTAPVQETPATVVTPVATDRATERQIAYAIDLQRSYWTPAVFGGRQYSRSELAALSRTQISRVIEALQYESRQ